MIELALQGFGAKEIAQSMGYSPQGVSNVMACAIFQDELARQRDLRQQVVRQTVASTVVDARDKLNSLALKAVNKAEELLKSTNENIALRSVTTILDRIDGLTVQEKPVEAQLLSKDRMILIIETMRERGLDPAKYVQSKVVETPIVQPQFVPPASEAA